MICADTSSLVRILEGQSGPDIALITRAAQKGDLVVAPPTVTELLSYTEARPRLADLLAIASVLPLEATAWERAGLARRKLKRLGFRATLADALIAQCCIDASAPLIAHDPDFRHFATHCGLTLAV
ncbi:PIN domain-containing protein [uncultured Brevundimonas sp.]|uniref:type II toxin-antitoxin system VapC family toxin n=1 Tax=uncultured Brevundimonas sp. TaxID=213418 RepID=UPI0030ECF7E4|tara:strand:+ start:3655 stop:4032 length:378 start_codon:yes stop_codon:yes gene_type:complete